MLVDHLAMEQTQQTMLSRPGRKRRARVSDISGAVERTKAPRRQPVPPAQRITKPEPDEDSGLGFDDPHEATARAADTAHLLRASLVGSVRKVTKREDTAARDSCFVRDARSASAAQPPAGFLKGVNPVSKCGKYRLSLAREPETRHRARYQTEGSRGAVKDSTGKTSPQVVLHGYTQPVALQMYVGSDADGCSPHLFYQSCRVTGKTASPSDELNLSGTVVIQTTMTPDKGGDSVSARCDCLGILKQRNVDIESRVAAAGGAAAASAVAAGGRRPTVRKGARTTSCRLVFRVTVLNGHGRVETLQIASRSIVCTQPQGVPEVTKLSITEASPVGGQELIVLGKNFVKDSRVVFTETSDSGATVWHQTVTPHKDHLQAVHLVCEVPAYWDSRPSAPRAISLTVRSGDRESDGVPFWYTAASAAGSSGVCSAAGSVADSSELTSTPDRAETGGKQLPNGVSQAAIAINRHFAETGEILLGAGVQPTEPAIKTSPSARAELTDPAAVSVAVQRPAALEPRTDKVPAMQLVPVAPDVGCSPSMFVTVALTQSAAGPAPLIQEASPATGADWTSRQEQSVPVRQEVATPTGWAAQQQQQKQHAQQQQAQRQQAQQQHQQLQQRVQQQQQQQLQHQQQQQQQHVQQQQQQQLQHQQQQQQQVQQQQQAQQQQQQHAADAAEADQWSPATRTDVSPQAVWPSATSQADSSQVAATWSPQSLTETPAATGQEAWSPTTAPGSAETTGWPSPQPEAPASQAAWSPPTTETAWSSPKTETPAASGWAASVSASTDGAADSLWKREVATIVSESVVQKWTAADVVEAVSQHGWSETVAAPPQPVAETWQMETETAVTTAADTTPSAWHGLGQTAPAEGGRSWSPESEPTTARVESDWTAVTTAGETASGEQSWSALAVDTKTSWAQKEAAPAPAPVQTWTAAEVEKTWSAPQQQQTQHTQPQPPAEQPPQWTPAAEVPTWSQQQLADVLQETVAASEPAPAPAQSRRSDPMWGEVAFPAPSAAPAEDPLSDLPKGMGLIDYINGDSV
ncbi:nuclear factor of activated T-cells 5-like [Amphibalanus amphitrite]|uniref:nuclear factor of activated T-cells 5-like n=1 Tax=Amphibalanus amphitrite TaxID=1232801 RepID=UPI001C9085AF|nr:nuclear factor of activated T-cells 5-like [Amphibalanus amphitrite]